MGMIRGGGRTQHVCSTDTHTPAAITGLATWIQAEWVVGTAWDLSTTRLVTAHHRCSACNEDIYISARYLCSF